MQRVRGLFLATTLLGLIGAAQALASDAWEQAAEVVEQTTTQMIDLLARSDQKDYQAHIDELRTILEPAVNFERVARGVMAKYYRPATPVQRERFVGVFKETLIKAYAKALLSYEIENYKVVAKQRPTPDADHQIVEVEVTGADGQRHSLINFMVRDEQGFRLTNLVVDGINLRQIFRNQFAEGMNTHNRNFDKVIAQWAEMVEPPKVAGGSA